MCARPDTQVAVARLLHKKKKMMVASGGQICPPVLTLLVKPPRICIFRLRS